ncbi:MAG: hypothetical protein HY040_18295 [Planctomycetes bacterium]|nr:hypothetical protein [Planctomycetota bacterium]
MKLISWPGKIGRFVTALLVLVLTNGPASAQQVHRNGFDGMQPAWVKGGFDAPFQESAHATTDVGPHDGQRCEYIQLDAKDGNYIHYQYAVGKAPIAEELSGSLWIKSNRPGIQFMARIVLPNERDPNNLENRLTTFIRAGAYDKPGRWQRLDLGRPVQLAKQQQQLMQAQLKRPVNFQDAYVDALVLNVYSGPGPTEVWIDDLEIGPTLFESPFQPALRTPGKEVTVPTSIPRTNARNAAVEFSGSRLVVGGKRYFFRAIRVTDTPLRVLRDAGFNAVFVDSTSSKSLINEAAELGLWVVPQLRVLSDDGKLTSAESLSSEASRYLTNNAVLFWHLGSTLAFEQAAPLSRAAQLMRQADPGRPLGADVWDGLLPYSRNLNLVGVHRWPLMTSMEIPKYRDWLEQRRNLANPGSFVWTWIQTHMPEWYTQILYEQNSLGTFKEPVGPQAEQIRLLAYTALAAGSRGLAFWSDRFLADSHQGRDRLLCCALLNQEIDMLEPLLLAADAPPQWIDTSVPDVKAAVFHTSKGILVLPMWIGRGAQFVPGQAAASKLNMTVPQVPQSMQAWEVTPADVRGLRGERVVGGTKITLPEFGLTAAVVFTSDTNVIVRFQEQARSRRQQAAQWAYDMAAYERDKVARVQEQLEKMGHTLPDATQLMNDADNRIKTTKSLWDIRNFPEAYREGQRALRPLRILMRAQWEEAVKNLDSPVSSPYAVTFFTLPRHWMFMDQISKMTPTANVLPGGDFETVPDRKQETWKVEDPTLDEVELIPQRVAQIQQPIDLKSKVPTKVELPHQGKQCAMLQIKPKNKAAVPAALERTLLAITSPTVNLQPGTLVQVSAWVRIPQQITASPDGALFYDSAGGEPLAIRLTEPTPWKKLVLYRRIPASGTMSVTLAMTGIGSVYFDDVRIEPLVPGVRQAQAAEKK